MGDWLNLPNDAKTQGPFQHPTTTHHYTDPAFPSPTSSPTTSQTGLIACIPSPTNLPARRLFTMPARGPSGPWQRLKPVDLDPLESMGLPSKGETRYAPKRIFDVQPCHVLSLTRPDCSITRTRSATTQRLSSAISASALMPPTVMRSCRSLARFPSARRGADRLVPTLQWLPAQPYLQPLRQSRHLPHLWRLLSLLQHSRRPARMTCLPS